MKKNNVNLPLLLSVGIHWIPSGLVYISITQKTYNETYIVYLLFTKRLGFRETDSKAKVENSINRL
jgi:hypothetical protein